MKIKLNPLVLVGSVICLVSMFFSYLTLRIPLLRYGISWYPCAIYLNHFLYGIPVVAVLLLISSLIDSKHFQLGMVILSAVVMLVYIVTFRNPLHGDAMNYILGLNMLIPSYVEEAGVSANAEMIARTIGMLSHLGLGFYLFLVGTVVCGFGALCQFSSSTPKSGSSKYSSTNQSQSSSHKY